MQTSEDIPSTYATSFDDTVYTAFEAETLSKFLGETVPFKFYEGKSPMFDDKNTMVDENADRREVWFSGKKISYFFHDYSAIWFQTKLACLDKSDIKVVVSETSKILLTAEQAESLLASLEADEKVRAEEKAWYQEFGTAWQTKLVEAYKSLGIQNGEG